MLQRIGNTLRNTLRNTALGSILGLTMVGLVAAPLIGCTPNQQKTIATLTGTLTQAVSNVAQLEGNPTLAAQLQTDGAAAEKAITNWQNGSAVDNVIEALGILQDDLNLIPGTSQYTPLVDIAIGTMQTLLSLIPPSAVTPNVAFKMAAHHNRTVFLGRPAPKNKTDFVKQWNAAVAAHPQLSAATIK